MVCFIGLLTVVLRKAFRTRRQLIEVTDRLQSYQRIAPPHLRATADAEMANAQFFLATTNAVIVFILLRLVLGLFGSDLTEPYRRLAAGLVMSLQQSAAGGSEAVH